nr:hypothetical protein [Spirochaetaceae bacterium]
LQCHWILDNKNRPVKGEAVVKGKKIIRSVDLRSQTVFPHCSLKESMARILSLGLPAVPVVDKDYSFMGEVSYETIQKISLQ